ncbi:cytidyltransferase-like protein [Bradyrhizobium diazoefficiens]
MGNSATDKAAVHPAPHEKIKTIEELGAVARAAQAEGRTVALCHGVFDLVHLGHVRHILAARNEADVVIVTVTADRFVNKDPGRPIFPENMRAEMLAALGTVDWVGINQTSSAEPILDTVRPDIYVKELALKAIHAAGKVLTGRPALETAKLLFEPKWNSIPHTRSFESWLMDVLENPFVRYRYFLDAEALCTAAHEQGFDIHSAWPAYRDSLDVYWHKKVLSADEKLRRATRHLDRSRLSFLGGRKLYLVGKADAVSAISASIEALVLDVDRMIDEPFGDSLPRVITSLASLRETILTTDILADDASDIEAITATLDSFHRIFSAIGRRDASAIAALTQSDQAFIDTWGQPAHFLVVRKRIEGS